MAQPTRESQVKRDLRTPKYRQRVERDKKKFYRKGKEKFVYKYDSPSPILSKLA